MTTQIIDREDLRVLVADTIEVPAEELTDEANLMDNYGVDSLMAMEILVVLQKRYGVKLDESRLAEVTSLNGVYAIMEEAVGS